METNWVVSGVDVVDKRGNPYYVVVIARDVQTGEMMVVYNQNFGQKDTLCCPIDAFKMSFKPMSEGELPEPEPVNICDGTTDRMMRFFDSDDYDEKLRILNQMNIMGELTDTIIGNMAATLDIVIKEGPLEKRYDELKLCIGTRARYESMRLRKK